MEGIYQCSVETPMGKLDGKITLKEKDNFLNGRIESMGFTSDFENGMIRDNTFEFTGNVSLFFGQIPYRANGMVECDELKIKIDSSKGIFIIKGRRV